MLQAHLVKQQVDPGLPPLQYTDDCFSLLRAANTAALYQPTHGEKGGNDIKICYFAESKTSCTRTLHSGSL